jgi:sigma-B regulation protein RsbU (phosphoserine phosphatase)
MGQAMTAQPSSILIVDDEELNSEGLARRLQRHDYAVSVARSGREALEMLGERRFDLVLLDIMMPGMNGLAVLKLLRRVDSLIDLPVIMVTARGESEDIVEALELGANDYVTKPLDLPVVLARIRTQLALRQAVSQVTDLEQKLDARNRELEAAAAELAAANERRRLDLQAAARIQQAFLPAALPEVPGVRVAWSFRPCGQLAGDFLNVFRLGEQHLGLCVLDVNGHGVAAALLSVTAGHLMARTARTPLPVPGRTAPGGAAAIVPPAQVAGELSKQLSGEAAAGQTCTLLYGILGLDTREFRFVSAGHPGPVHLPSGSPPTVLEGSGFPVGVGPADYREQVVGLQPGDRLVLYSGGLTEARNADGEHFGARRLLDALGPTCRLPLGESLEALLENVERWRGDSPPHDDIAILAAEIVAAEAPAVAEPA